MPRGDDPLDWAGRKANWITGEKYTENRNEWARTWSKFPLYSDKPRLLALVKAFKTSDVTILTSGTGSGKTVLAIPLMLRVIGTPTATVVATMPKRAAVLAAARKGATTLDVQMGKEIGYRYRSSEKAESAQSARTGGTGRLIYATDGFVLAQSRSDPTLSDYDAVIIDEAHERGVPSDMLILAVLRAQQARDKKKDPLRLVIMSATIDPVMFEQYFARFGVTTSTVHVSGESLYPVERRYLASKPADPIERGLALARDLIEKNARNSGKILLFVPTTRDAVHGCDLFRIACRKAACNQTPCASLYGKQSSDQQMDALSKDGVEGDGPLIVATNVAESSLTINDIKHVIDTGLQLSSSWMPLAHGTKLAIGMASQAQISQRVGRTGRTGPGTAHLMYTRAQHDALLQYPPPSIATSDITDSLLSEMIAGRKDLKGATEELQQLLTPPSADQFRGAEAMLRHCGLVAASGAPTWFGRACYRCMRNTRLDLWNALLVVRAGPDPDLLREALQLCSVLEMVQQGASLWTRIGEEEVSGRGGPSLSLVRQYSRHSGDHEALVRVLQDRAMEGNFEGLAKGVWKKIVSRANELTSSRALEKCMQLFSENFVTAAATGRSKATIGSVVLEARSLHTFDSRGRLPHVRVPSQRRPQVQTWFGGKATSGCYEMLVMTNMNTARLSLITKSR